MFAHQDAKNYIERAAKDFKQLEYPSTDVMKCNDYEWPDWIPVQIREQIKSFWAEEFGRSPKAWLNDSKERNSTILGSVVTLLAFIKKKEATGKYIHCWNNIGKLICEDGTIEYVSF